MRLPASFDLVGIQRGRMIVSLTTFRIRGFFPLALERSLASKLARRDA